MTMDSGSGPDRRAPGATRIPFEALVEISPSLGPSFQAQAVDVSDGGMHLRTAYLPELGQRLLCRFDVGGPAEINAECEVLWREEHEQGGEFGMRFVDLDPQGAEAIARITSVREKTIKPSGAKVRLHIDGLGFPMKARVKDSSRKQITVGNDLGFLQVGKQLELEDAETGEKRAANIDGVEVEIDPESRVPRLVVGLRYTDASESMPMPHAEAAKEATPEPIVMDQEDELPKEQADHAPMQSAKSMLASGAAKVTPALVDFAKRTRRAAGVLWDKRKQRAREKAEATRRTTAPPPGGGLHATGRKVVRATDLVTPRKGRIDTRRKVVLGAVSGLAVVLAFAAIHKPKTESAQRDKPVATDATALAVTPPPPVPSPAPPPPPPVEPAALAQNDSDETEHHGKHMHVMPFGNGSVSHGNVLKLKMDGAIEKINGATQPTGFTISVPGRRALEPAGPLAARDNRIASIKVTNEGTGSQLDVSFKDGVPSYLVRARGDELEMVLAPPGHVDASPRADKSDKPAVRKHHKHSGAGRDE